MKQREQRVRQRLQQRLLREIALLEVELRVFIHPQDKRSLKNYFSRCGKFLAPTP